MVGNLAKARKSWGRLYQILRREGGGYEDVSTFLQSGGAGGVSIQGGDVGDYPSDEAGLG